MVCLKKADYLLAFGEIFLATGLSLILYSRQNTFFLPPAVISTIIIFPLTLLTLLRKHTNLHLTISLVAPFFLSTPLLVISASLIQSYAKEGKYSSPFIAELLDKTGNGFITVGLLIAGVFSLASYLLVKALVLPGVKALTLEGGKTLAEEYIQPPQYKVSYLAIPLGILFPYLYNASASTIAVLPFIMLAPLPLQTSTLMGLLLSIIGISLNPLAVAFSLILYAEIWRKLWKIGTYRPASLIIGTGVYILASLLIFFTLFGAQFTMYLVTATFLILIVGYAITELEAKGIALSPYLLLFVSQIFTNGSIPIYTDALLPLILSASPLIVSALYLDISLRHIDEECGTLLFESLLLLVPLVLAALLYGNITITPPSLTISTSYSLISYLIPVLALIYSTVQQVSMKGRIPRRIEPTLLFSLHPLGLAVSILIPKNEALPLLLLALLLSVTRLVLSRHSQMYSEIARFFLFGYAIGIISKILLVG
ncbi:hypothetical protein TCARB_0066 [Thermofilum adornatum 1505]|uniref:Uncharacterized protein n=1 Tax=Thermofilum adornatum 1505 TaxID=697581 RepID=A0A3G1A765_9CREN|nr:hypothetical protein TCARB_0066 [Thermofilum adornatum 1505]